MHVVLMHLAVIIIIFHFFSKISRWFPKVFLSGNFTSGGIEGAAVGAAATQAPVLRAFYKHGANIA